MNIKNFLAQGLALSVLVSSGFLTGCNGTVNVAATESAAVSTPTPVIATPTPPPSETAAIDGSWSVCWSAADSMFSADTKMAYVIDHGLLTITTDIYDSSAGSCDGHHEVNFTHVSVISLAEVEAGHPITDHHSATIDESDGAYAVNVVGLSHEYEVLRDASDPVAAGFLGMLDGFLGGTHASHVVYDDLQIDENTFGLGITTYTSIRIRPSDGAFYMRSIGGPQAGNNGITAEDRFHDLINLDEDGWMPAD